MNIGKEPAGDLPKNNHNSFADNHDADSTYKSFSEHDESSNSLLLQEIQQLRKEAQDAKRVEQSLKKSIEQLQTEFNNLKCSITRDSNSSSQTMQDNNKSICDLEKGNTTTNNKTSTAQSLATSSQSGLVGPEQLEELRSLLSNDIQELKADVVKQINKSLRESSYTNNVGARNLQSQTSFDLSTEALSPEQFANNSSSTSKRRQSRRATASSRRGSRGTLLRRLFWNDGPGTEDENVKGLPEDSFTFLLVSKSFASVPFWTALALFCMQVATYSLLLVHGIDRTNETNPMQIPANVNSAVRATQIIAIIITVLTQDDLRMGLDQINRGYRHEIFQHNFPEVSFGKWVAGVVARCLEGGLGIAVTLFLILNAQTAIDLLLNFTAMEFVSQLDEITFILSEQGFLGIVNQEQAEVITDTKFKMEREGFRLPPIIILLFTMIAMLAGWIAISSKQESGAFLCQSIMVQFGDDYDPNLGAFSGIYDRGPAAARTGFFSNTKVVYSERKSSGKAMFGYCASSRAWAFVHGSNARDSTAQQLDPCQWKAISEVTSSYDLLSTKSLNWYVKNDEGTVAILSPLLLECHDCSGIVEKNRAQCNHRGTCSNSNSLCECTPGWYGPRCEFHEPCPSMQVDELHPAFQINEESLSSEFRILKDGNDNIVESYSRPIYVQPGEYGYQQVVLFTGKRWAITTWNITEPLVTYFTNNEFHAYWYPSIQEYISQAMDILSPTNYATPINLQWYKAKARHNVSQQGLQGADTVNGIVNAAFLCAVCSKRDNPCFYNGTCNSEGKCECSNGASGTLCQVLPTGNGVCDPFFNTPEFDFDGGDCDSD